MLLCALVINVPEAPLQRPLEPQVQDSQSNDISGGTLASINKALLRKQLFTMRRSIPHLTQRLAARRLIQHSLSAGLHWRAHRIGVYMSMGSEIATQPLIQRLRSLGKQVFLPVLSRQVTQRKLWFVDVGRHPNWVTNRFGIQEAHGGHAIRAQQLDVLFLPLVGFDAHGYRLGMGGGFYDASLAHLHVRRVWRKPVRIGLAYDCQLAPHPLPHDAWDVPLDAILTESGLRWFPLHSHNQQHSVKVI